MNKTLGLVGLAAVTLGSSFSAMPAMASAADCGPTPTGGTLTESNGFCTLKFTTAGSYSFTSPAALSHLAAVSIGGGGGLAQYGDNGTWAVGYAGNAGGVEYSDFTNVAQGEAFTIVVGAGGTSSTTPINGTSSSITSGAQTLTGTGGAPQSTDVSCGVGVNTGLGVGDGAGGNTTSRGGEPCVQGPGFNFSTAFPTLFPTNDVVFGLGGMLFNSGSLPALAPGSGASGLLNADASTFVSFDAHGADGGVIFRWAVPVGLANTGSDSQGIAGFAAGAIAVGAALIAASRKRARFVPRHRA